MASQQPPNLPSERTATTTTLNLTPSGKIALDSLLSSTITDQKATASLPGLFFAATNADEVIYENQDGWMDWEKGEEGSRVNEDTVLHMFSMTKFVTSLACHILIDHGHISSLDDEVVIEKYLPELNTLNILERYEGETPIFRKPARKITLRTLLNHTSGMCYDWFAGDDRVTKWREQEGLGTLFTGGQEMRSYEQPLIFEPGTEWRYSIGIDWAGFLVERMTGQTLEHFMQEHIFLPLGMSSTTFYPRPDIVERLFRPCAMDPDTGELKAMTESPLGKPNRMEDLKLCLGGAGLYSTTRDYLKLLQAVLKSSPSYHTPPTKPLISPASFNELFTPSLTTSKATSDLCQFMTRSAYHHPPPTPFNVQHSPGLAIYLEDGDWGRKAMSGCWDGALKTSFWIDPASGIAGQCNTNVLCPSNENVIKLTFNAFEKTLYENLVKEGASRVQRTA